MSCSYVCATVCATLSPPGLPVVLGFGSRNTNDWQLRPVLLFGVEERDRDRGRVSTKEELRSKKKCGRILSGIRPCGDRIKGSKKSRWMDAMEWGWMN